MLTREELFELVWQRPLSHLAVELGTSSARLTKICAQLDIPRPTSGHWTKLAVGKAPPRPCLPASATTAPITLPSNTGPTKSAAGPAVGKAPPRPGLPTSANTAPITPPSSTGPTGPAASRAEKTHLVVPARLSKPCSLVSDAKTALNDAQLNSHGLLEAAGPCLNIKVSRAHLPRALRIADTLLKAFAKRDWRVTLSADQTNIYVDDVTISMAIEERLESVEVTSKPNPRADRYLFNFNRRVTERRPSGYLSIAISESPRCWNAKQQRNWNGSPKRALEDRVDSVVAGVLKLASAANVEQARRAQKAAAKEQRRREHQERIDEQRRLEAAVQYEKERVTQLLNQAGRWRDCRNLRSFIEHAERLGGLPELGLSGEAFTRWREWATTQADRLDPLTPNPTSTPSTVDG